MIDRTENKNAYTQPNAKLRFPKINGAFEINEAAKKPFVRNSGEAFPENYNVRKFSSNRILASLNAADFSRLQPYLEPVSLSFGKILCEPQDRVRYVYFPESAVISNLQMLEDGRTIEIAMTGREGVTGLSSVFNSQPASDWTEVSVAGSALRLNAQILKQEFYCYGTLQTSLFKYLGSYIEQISQRVICNNYHLMEKRFCSWLSMLQNRHYKNKFLLTHEQIARYLGVQRPLVSNLARKLREAKIIDYRRKEIIILDCPKLQSLTCPCFHAI